MKKLALSLFAFIALLMCACGGGKTESAQPDTEAERYDSLRTALAAEERTMIFYESPLRLLRTLEQLAEAFGADRDASVSREISKLHNTTHNGTLAQLVDYFTQNAPRGEIVIVVAGKQPETTVKVDKYAQFKQRNRVVDPDEQ